MLLLGLYAVWSVHWCLFASTSVELFIPAWFGTHVFHAPIIMSLLTYSLYASTFSGFQSDCSIVACALNNFSRCVTFCSRSKFSADAALLSWSNGISLFAGYCKLSQKIWMGCYGMFDSGPCQYLFLVMYVPDGVFLFTKEFDINGAEPNICMLASCCAAMLACLLSLFALYDICAS